jgi:hypothetical protein
MQSQSVGVNIYTKRKKKKKTRKPKYVPCAMLVRVVGIIPRVRNHTKVGIYRFKRKDDAEWRVCVVSLGNMFFEVPMLFKDPYESLATTDEVSEVPAGYTHSGSSYR